MSGERAQALRAFEALPLTERLFVRARLSSAPLEELARRAPAGRIVDIGCGHGVLSALLATRSDRQVLGIDPDPRKIDWASRSVGRLPNAKFEVGTVQELAARSPEQFDAAVVADVLYLLPTAEWLDFLRATSALLKPGGVLLLKEAEADQSWRYWKCVAQEALMVRLLRRTQSSGAVGFAPRAVLESNLTDAGFAIDETVSLARGYTTPHVLFVARKAAR
ncbi:MAG: class I SAM-dependent methyltransferase [Myxococcaceae bacterium]